MEEGVAGQAGQIDSHAAAASSSAHFQFPTCRVSRDFRGEIFAQMDGHVDRHPRIC